MSEGLGVLGEVTASYVLKNRENGWLEYALQVLAAGPYLRSELIRELCEDVRQALAERHEVAVWTSEPRAWIWFSVNVTADVWRDLDVRLANWKHDASEVAISVYNDGDALSDAASAQIRSCLATKRSPWHRKRHPEWTWNIWPDRSDWSGPEFLLRVANEREVVVGEVTKDLLEIVELADDLLKRIAKPASA